MVKKNTVKKSAKKPVIGFVGQGYVGKNYADDFERRGLKIVRYSLDKKFAANKPKIAECDIVFIAVPTPTTPEGFNDGIIRQAVKMVGKGKIAVIKSTIVPGTTEKVQKENPDIFVLHSPEFLSETTAAEDVRNPFSNIVGIPKDDSDYRRAADAVLAVLPKAPFSLVCRSAEAEFIKYAHNGNGYTRIIFFNLMYDMVKAAGLDWKTIEKALAADPLVCNRYLKPVHKSGRGAGGHCFIKDFAALRAVYENIVGDRQGVQVFRALEEKNKSLLAKSGKDLDLLEGVYGKGIKDGPVKND